MKVYLVLIVTSILWGLVPLALKIALRELPPFTISFLRFFIAFIVFAVLGLFNKETFNIKREFFRKLLISLFLFGNMFFYAYGIQSTSTISGVLLYTVGPAITAVVSYLFLKETLNKFQTIGMIISFLGAFLIVFLPVLEKGESWAIGTFLGNFFVSLAVILFSFYSVGSKPLLRNNSPISLSCFSAGTASLIFFFFSLIEIQKGMVSFSPGLSTILAIVYMGLGGTVATILLYQWLIKRTSAFTANLTAYIQILTTGLAGYIFLEEKITVLFIFGSILVLAGVFMVTNIKYFRSYQNK